MLEEEIFGPVAPIVGFATEDEAIAAANQTEYGLVAYVYTRDLDRAFRVIDALETGMVGLNRGLVSNAAAPFGGVKASGFGREGGTRGSSSIWKPSTSRSTSSGRGTAAMRSPLALLRALREELRRASASGVPPPMDAGVPYVPHQMPDAGQQGQGAADNRSPETLSGGNLDGR